MIHWEDLEPGTWAVLALIGIQVSLSGAVLLRPQRRQASSLAWLLVILLLPGLGIFLWLLLGEVRLGSARRRAHLAVQEAVRDHLEPLWEQQREPDLPVSVQALAALGRTVCRTGPREGNALRLVADSDEFIIGLARDIDEATESVHVLTYIWEDDDSGRAIAEAIARAAQRGLRCRVLADAIGARAMLGGPLQALMEEAGAQVEPALVPEFLPLLTGRVDLRNHRKIAVLDHRVGWVGSQNIADADYAPKRRAGRWVDCSLRMEGPAACDLEQLFAEDWELDSGESIAAELQPAPPVPGGVPVQVMGTGPNSENAALVQIVQAMVHLAKQEVVLTTPYFVPDEGTLAALTTAALRGVEVTLLLPRHNDSRLVATASRSFYDPLLEAGVRVHEYLPDMLHAKTMTIDREVAYIGSANMDRRSFEINFEVSTVIYDADMASHLRLLQMRYLDASERVDPTRWRKRSMVTRLVQNAAGLLSPIL